MGFFLISNVTFSGDEILWTFGPQILLVATLGAITIYRREMSCNHCYHPVETVAAAAAAAADPTSSKDQGETASATTTTLRTLTSSLSSCCDEMEEFDENKTEEIVLDDRATAGPYGSGAASLIAALISGVYSVLYDYWMKLLSLSSWTAPPSAVVATTTARSSRRNVLDDSNSTRGISRGEQQASPQEHCCCERASSSAAAHDGEVCSSLVGVKNAQHALVGGSLPPDTLVHILSHLPPRDVISFGSTCHAAKVIVAGVSDDSTEERKATSTTSSVLWKTLWCRDYAWIVESWDIGRQAMERAPRGTTSAQDAYSTVTFDKDFYFRFAASWMNFVLAGRNCVQNGCFVGLGGHVYDMTKFVLIHPGSPETVLVQAGRDATSFFLNVRHSANALRLAQTMCVVVDQSRFVQSKTPQEEGQPQTSTCSTSCCGLRPTRHTRGLEPTLGQHKPEETVLPELSKSNMHMPCANNLQRIHTQHSLEESKALERAQQKHGAISRLTDINVFYNSFLQKWQAWYTNPNMETVFCEI